MNATPIMCHQAEIMFSPDVIRMSSRLISTARIRQTAYIT